ncbi:MAG TPA: hypothetical protein VHZ95_17145, partial [Polyangiales bacterium]|nr:hypothetical protein [Polyangiales bacterium]
MFYGSRGSVTRALGAFGLLGSLAACGADPVSVPMTPTIPMNATSGPAGSAAPITMTTTGTPTPVATALPCAISQILVTNCQSCHAPTPLNGAPMPLVTLADLTAPARTDATMKVYQMMIERVQDRARPMPPDPTKRLSDADLATLQTWVTGGAQAGTACPSGTGNVASGMTAGGPAAGGGGVGATAGSGGSAGSLGGAGAGGADTDPLDADIENCYELRAHGQPTPGDTTKYAVPAGETYTSFIFKAPWTTPVQGLRFRHLPDNVAVLHHWLLYSESAQVADGAISPCALSGPGGALCGQAS